MQSFERGPKLASAQKSLYWETSRPEKIKSVTGRAAQSRNYASRQIKSQNNSKWKAVNSHVISMTGNSQNAQQANQQASENLG